MKIMHVSDLHIGIHLYHYDLLEDQKFVFSQIVNLVRQHKPDAFLIAGDIYDKSVPSAEAVELFDAFITSLREADKNMAIMMISGNHDSPQRIDCYRNILKVHGIYAVGLPPESTSDSIEKVTLRDAYGDVHFYLLPFVKPSLVRKIIGDAVSSHNDAVHSVLAREEIDTSDRNVLVSHQFYVRDKADADGVPRAQNEVCTVGNIDSVVADCLKDFDYVALGHLHKPMQVGDKGNVWYSGTPMAYSLSEEGQTKYVNLVTLEEKTEKPKVEQIELLPYRKVRTVRGDLETVLEEPSEDYIWVKLTDKVDIDISDLQMRLYDVFPNLLGVRNEKAVSDIDKDIQWEKLENVNSYELFEEFYPELEEEEKEILQEVIRSVEGVD